jgi:Domain of unknown function (DUF4440)
LTSVESGALAPCARWATAVCCGISPDFACRRNDRSVATVNHFPNPMNTLLRFVALLALTLAAPLRAADSSAAIIADVTAADDERVAASIAVDRARLDAIFSDELHYAHSNGAIDTKASYVDSIVNHRSVYEKYEYQKRTFTPVAPGVVTMTGRALIHSRNAAGPNLIDLNFLAVWRQENGKWRFFAWQSCRNAPAAPAKP